MPIGEKEQSTVEIGVWIPSEILQRKELSDREKVLLSAIVQLYRKNCDCFASNGYFARWTGIPPKKISEKINVLANQGLVKTKMIYEGKQIVRRQLIPNMRRLKIKPKRMRGVPPNRGEGIPESG